MRTPTARKEPFREVLVEAPSASGALVFVGQPD